MDELRAQSWDEFIGQDKLKSRLDIHIAAARQENRSLEHILIAGPPGFGKTSLATIIARKLKRQISSFTMPLNERAIRDIVRHAQGIVMLDEIHRATPKEQESLLSVLEFGTFRDRKGYLETISNPRNFTIIAATTERHRVIPPLMDRFPIKPDFDKYSRDEMTKIVESMARKANLDLDVISLNVLGGACGGVPRAARQFVLAARDLKVVNGGVVPCAREILSLCRVTAEGFTNQHIDYLQFLVKNNGTSGLRSIKTHLGVNESVVLEIERFLMDKGLINYTDQGRELTREGYDTARTIGRP